VTVQVAELPEVNDVGSQPKENTVAVGNTDKEAVFEAPFNVAVSVMVRFVAVEPAVAVKVAEVAPAGTVMVAGMVSKELLSDSATTLPPDAAD